MKTGTQSLSADHLRTCWILPLVLSGFVGCGPSSSHTEFANKDVEQIVSLVWNVGDAARNAERVQGLFVPGSDPTEAERTALASLSYSLVSDPKITGESATVRIRVSSAQGEILGEVEWTAAREAGGEWKLRSAPTR